MKRFLSILIIAMLILGTVNIGAAADDSSYTTTIKAFEKLNEVDTTALSEQDTKWKSPKESWGTNQTSFADDNTSKNNVVFQEFTVKSESQFVFYKILPMIGAEYNTKYLVDYAVGVDYTGLLTINNSSYTKQLSLDTEYKIGIRYDFRNGKNLMSVYIDEVLVAENCPISTHKDAGDSRAVYGFKLHAFPYHRNQDSVTAVDPCKGKISVTNVRLMTGNPYDKNDIYECDIPSSLIAPPKGKLSKISYTAKVKGVSVIPEITSDGESVSGISVDGSYITVANYAAADEMKTLNVKISYQGNTLEKTVKLYPAMAEDYESGVAKTSDYYTLTTSGGIKDNGGNKYANASGSWGYSTRFIPKEAFTSDYGLITIESKAMTVPIQGDDGLGEIAYLCSQAETGSDQPDDSEILLGAGALWGENKAVSKTDTTRYTDDSLRPTADSKYSVYLLGNSGGTAVPTTKSNSVSSLKSAYTPLGDDFTPEVLVSYKAEIDLQNGVYNYYVDGKLVAENYKIYSHSERQIGMILWGIASDDFAVYSGKGEDFEGSYDIKVKTYCEGTLTNNTFSKGTFKAEAEVINGLSDPLGVTVVAAQYNSDGELIAVNVSDCESVEASNSKAVSTTLNVTSVAGTYIKVMVLDNLDNLKPYCPAVKATPNVKLVLMGDSVCADYTGTLAENGLQGWGHYLTDVFNTMTVDNTARSGWSTKNYLGEVGTKKLGEKFWDDIKAELNKGDYLIIALGINDASKTPGHQGATDEETFRTNYTKFISEAKAKGAEVILVSPTIYGYETGTTDVWNYDKDPWSERGKVIKDIAQSNGICYLPLGETLVTTYNEMKSLLMSSNGMSETDACNKVRNTFYLFSPTYDDYLKLQNKEFDATHFNKDGAKAVSDIIVKLIKNSDSSLKEFING